MESAAEKIAPNTIDDSVSSVAIAETDADKAKKVHFQSSSDLLYNQDKTLFQSDPLYLSLLEQKFDESILNELKEKINSENISSQYYALVCIRKILCFPQAPIQEIIDSGIISKIIQLMSLDKPETLQFESAWCVLNIASGNSLHVESIIDNDGVNKLLTLFDSPSCDVIDQAIWALGNIAGDSIKNRDMLLNTDITNRILNYIPKVMLMSQSALQNVIWTISQLCRGKPKVKFDQFKHTIPLLSYALLNPNSNVDIIKDCCCALAVFSDGPNHQ